jgi:DNA-binding MarR family transcriptional regulator
MGAATTKKPAPRAAQLASEVWGAMVHAVTVRREHLVATASKFELTMPQAHLLRVLQYGPARTMTSIADSLSCDASNVTGIVDRLEARGLIQRGITTHDRRIKTIALTSQGNAVLKELQDGFLQPPASLHALSYRRLTTLHEIFCRTLGWLQDSIEQPGQRPSGSSRTIHARSKKAR